MNICLAISVYDKYYDLINCVNSARHNGFKHVYVLSSSDANISHLSKVCNELEVELIVVETSAFKTTSSKPDFYNMITPRVWDLQRTAVNNLSKYYDYIVHTHADGWIMSKNFLAYLRDFFRNSQDVLFLYRGVGENYKIALGSPLGSIDDHFYVVNTNSKKQLAFFEKKYEDFSIMNLNIHGILSIFAYVICKPSEKYHYDNTTLWKEWDGSYRDSSVANPLRPFVYNNKLGLLHCQNDDFPPHFGESLQKNIWLENNIPLDKFVFSGELSINDFKKLESRYKRMKTTLSALGLYQNRYGQYFMVEKDFKNIYLKPWQLPLILIEKLIRFVLKKRKIRIIEDERIR